MIWCEGVTAPALGLAPDPEHDKLYALLRGSGPALPRVLDGATGQVLRVFHWSADSSLFYSAAANRAFLTWNGNEVTAVDCDAGTIVGVTPLAPNIIDACLDSVGNRLYFTAGRSGVGIVDCASGKVRGYARASDRLRQLAFNSRDDKLYCSSDSSIFVLDCRVDSFVKTIPIGGWTHTMNWLRTLNKLYALASADTDKLVVVDCAGDTVVKEHRSVSANCSMLVCPELNQLWLIHGGYKVVDCLRDSLLDDTWVLSNCKAADYDTASHRAYLAGDNIMYVVDMETRQPVDSVLLPHSYNRGAYGVLCAGRAGRAYWTWFGGAPYDPDTTAVVDIRCDSIVSRLLVPFFSAGTSDDRSGDYVYFSGYHEIVAADARTDSVVSSVAHPVSTQFLFPYRAINRFYAVGLTDSVIQVVYDSVIFADVQESPIAPWVARPQSILSRTSPLLSSTAVILFDASGRRVAFFRNGSNDISHLAPGVYFLREPRTYDGRAEGTIRKVVITR